MSNPTGIENQSKLTDKPYKDMTLAELLETRDKLINNECDINRLDDGPLLFKWAMATIQTLIYKLRTERKSGLIIPYNKDINYN